VARPRNTGLVSRRPVATRYAKKPDRLDNRRRIVDSATPDAPSEIRTTFDDPYRWALTNPNTSAVVTSSGSRSTTPKNTLRSKAVAGSVFRRARARTSSKYSSTSG
jgi:hypothetical protein